MVLGLVALAVVAVACAPNATQSALEPKGPYAQKSFDLFVPVFWVAVGIFVIVEGLLLLFVIRYRHRKNQTARIPAQIHGNTRLEIAWTILPTLILAGVAVPTIATIWDLAAKPTGDVLEVNVLAHQWWWEFDYPGQDILTANELHIPTGRPVYLTLCAVGFGYGTPVPSQGGPPAPNACQTGPPDGQPPAAIGAAVIHSFWVPELAGTQDVVPDLTNHLTIQADEPGVYQGQCKEFCGLSHAYMKFKVVAHTPADFERWVAEQQAPASPDVSGPARGRQGDLPADVHGLPRRRRARDRERPARDRQRRAEPHAPDEPAVLPRLHAGDQRREPGTLDRGPALVRGGFVHARLRSDVRPDRPGRGVPEHARVR